MSASGSRAESSLAERLGESDGRLMVALRERDEARKERDQLRAENERLQALNAELAAALQWAKEFVAERKEAK